MSDERINSITESNCNTTPKLRFLGTKVRVKSSKNADIDKCKYSGYGIGFVARGNFLFPGDGRKA